jgi:hypothetical protein
MSDPNRAQYAQERPLAFDGYPAPRRGGPAPVTLILSLFVLVAAAGGVFYLYRGGLREPGGPPRPVGAPVGDVRVAAPSQPQAPDPATGLTIYKDHPSTPEGAPAFVPPPEQPTPRPVAQAALPTAPPSPVPAKSAATAKSASIDTLLAADAAPIPSKPPSPKPALVSTSDGKPADPKGAPYTVQIGAFSSETMADKGWNGAAEEAPGDMAGKGKRVVPVTKPDGTVLYRTAITGFASRDEAVALCAKLSAVGKSCFVR